MVSSRPTSILLKIIEPYSSLGFIVIMHVRLSIIMLVSCLKLFIKKENDLSLITLNIIIVSSNHYCNYYYYYY